MAVSHYTEADPDVYKVAHQIIQQYYPELLKREVTYKIIFAWATKDKKTGKPKGPAMQTRGCVVNGYCRITSLKERCKDGEDFEIVLDGDRWKEWSPTEQASLLHHELHHVEVLPGYDKADRPKLKLRPHDVEIGLFVEIMEVYKEKGLEAQIAKKAIDKIDMVQGYFQNWG